MYFVTKTCFLSQFCDDPYSVTKLWRSLFVTTKSEKCHEIYAMADMRVPRRTEKHRKTYLLLTWRWLGYDVANPFWRFDSSQNNEWPNKAHLESIILWAKLQAHYVLHMSTIFISVQPICTYYSPFLIQPITNIAAQSPIKIEDRITQDQHKCSHIYHLLILVAQIQ